MLSLRMERVIANTFFAFLALIIIPALYTLFIMLPVDLYNTAECLEKGYPRGTVTIGLERYCSTLDGAVTVKVEKQK